MHIVYVGYPGFPIGHAQVERQKLISKGLLAAGCSVTVISRYGVQDKKDIALTPASRVFESIAFEYASGITYRPDNLFTRNFYKGKGLITELYLIWKKKRANNLNALLITTNSFYNVVYYSIIAYLCAVPSILDNVEFWGNRPGTSLWRKLDHYLYDHFAYKLASKVLCISDLLLDTTQKGDPRKPVLKVPVIVDYSKFLQWEYGQEPFFLFCGGAGYFDTIDLVIEAYERLQQCTYKLYIVSNGNKQQVAKVKDRIRRSPYGRDIIYFANLDYAALINLYTSSRALLIPLLEKKQDQARFPHKIGEYCASKRAIITTNVGEIGKYFTDQVNALIADTATPEAFASKMQFVIDYPHEAELIGQESFLIGQEHFDHIRLGKKIADFILGNSRSLEAVSKTHELLNY